MYKFNDGGFRNSISLNFHYALMKSNVKKDKLFTITMNMFVKIFGIKLTLNEEPGLNRILIKVL